MCYTDRGDLCGAQEAGEQDEALLLVRLQLEQTTCLYNNNKNKNNNINNNNNNIETPG